MKLQFFCYAGAGTTGTLVHYAVLVALVQLAAVGPVPASTAGAVAGAWVNMDSITVSRLQAGRPIATRCRVSWWWRLPAWW